MCILMLGCKGLNKIYWIRLKDFKLRGNTWHPVLSIGATVLASQKGCLVCYLQVTDLPTTWLVEALNPLSPKIWLIILKLQEFLSNYPLQTGQFAGQLLLLSAKFLLGHRLEFIENECCSKLALPMSEFSQTTFLLLWITENFETGITKSWHDK